MSSCWATRRASSTSATLQQPVSLSPPHSRIVTPTTSWPSRAQQRGGDRRVDAAAHRDQHLHGVTASRGRALAQRGDGVARSPSTARRRRRRWSCGRGVIRSAPAAQRRSTPIAASTCDGSIAPLAHADAADAHTPASSSRYSSASLSMPSKQHVGRAGDLGGRRRRSRAAPGTPATSPATRRSRSAAMRTISVGPLGVGGGQRRGEWRRCRRRCACRCAARAPGRRRRSAARAPTPSRTASTPTPFGPPNLWALSDSRSTCGHSVAQVEPARPPGRRRCAAAAPGARSRTTAATAARSVIDADLVVDRHHADDGDVGAERGGERVEVDAAGARRRRRRCRRGARRRAARRGARRPGTPAGRRARRTAPVIAALSASVPHAGEHDLARPAADDVGDDVAGLVDGPAGVAGEAVRAARVGEALGEERQHRLDRLGPHRRRRRVVEVDRAGPRLDTLTLATTAGVEPRAWRATRRSSYGDAFADVYDDWYAGISDADGHAPTSSPSWPAASAGDRRPRVLELGVGTGRLAVPLADARRRRRTASTPARRCSPGSRARDPDGRVTRVARRHGRRPARRTVRRRARRLQLAVQPGDADAPGGLLRRRRRAARAGRRVRRRGVRARGPAARGHRRRRAVDDRPPRSCCRSPTHDPGDAAGRTVTSSSSPTASGCGCGRGRSATRRPTELDAMAAAAGLAPGRALGGLRPSPVRRRQPAARQRVRPEPSAR